MTAFGAGSFASGDGEAVGFADFGDGLGWFSSWVLSVSWEGVVRTSISGKAFMLEYMRELPTCEVYYRSVAECKNTSIGRNLYSWLAHSFKQSLEREDALRHTHSLYDVDGVHRLRGEVLRLREGTFMKRRSAETAKRYAR